MTPSRPYHHGNLAAAAVAAAEAEIDQMGIAATSLRKVADRLGVSHTAIGKRFGDKAGLLAAVAAEGYRALGDTLAAAGTDMRRLGQAYLRFAAERPALFAVMFQPAVYRADDPAVAAAEARTDALLRAGVGQADGPMGPAAVGAWALVHGLASLWLAGALEGDLATTFDEVADALFPGGPPAARDAVSFGSE